MLYIVDEFIDYKSPPEISFLLTECYLRKTRKSLIIIKPDRITLNQMATITN